MDIPDEMDVLLSDVRGDKTFLDFSLSKQPTPSALPIFPPGSAPPSSRALPLHCALPIFLRLRDAEAPGCLAGVFLV